MKKINSIVISTIAAAFLVGCGGGGGGGSSTPPAGGNTSNTNISGSVIDGYIKNAMVCLDLSLDGICDNSEPSAKTDSNGAYNLTITPTQQNHQNFNIAPLIAYGGTDIDTNDDFIGKLQAQVNGTTANVTPLTTLFSKLIQEEVTSSTTKEQLEAIKKEKKELIKRVFNITSSEIDEDFIKSENIELTKTALQLQKSVDLITNLSNDGTQDNEVISDKVYDLLVVKMKSLKDETDNSKLSVLNVVEESLNDIKENSTITGKTLSVTEIDRIKLLTSNIAVSFENLTGGYNSIVEKIITLTENQKNKVIDNTDIIDYKEDKAELEKSNDELNILALENFLKILDVNTTYASSLFEDGITKNNIISKFTDSSETELHTKYSEIKSAVDDYNKKQNEQSKIVSAAIEAIKILEKMNIETDNVDTKISEAKKKVEGLSQSDAVMVQNILDLTNILNTPEISNVLEIEANSLTETSITGKLVKSTVLDTVTFSEKYNGIASNSIIVMNKMATQLKKISDSIGAVYENESYVFEYGSETINYDSSLALRGTILAIAFKLDFIASYSWGDDEDIKTRVRDEGPSSFEYQNINIDPSSVLNKGSAFKLVNSSRLDGSRAYLIEGLELINTISNNNDDIKNEDKIELQKMLASLKGNGSYELVEEREDYSWDDSKWELDNSYQGDRTTYTEKIYVDLGKMLNSSYAIDITSFGSDFEMVCNEGMQLSEKYTIANNSATCVPVTSTVTHTESANISPKIKPTTSTSKLDDVITKIIDEDGNELAGQDVIDYILD